MKDGIISVTHLITGTSTGGAETMLLKLVSRMDRKRFSIDVISLTDVGEIGRRIIESGVDVFPVRASRGVPDPLALARIARRLRRQRPDVLQTWMYHADLAGALASRAAGSMPVAWNIRHSDLDPAHISRRTIRVAKICARLSRRLPERIVCCSRASRDNHVEMGYDPDKMVVIPNGFDTSVFRPDREARSSMRKELGLGEDVLLIGLAARYHPQKDHETFIAAAKQLLRDYPDVRFLLCGEDITEKNAELAGLINKTGLGKSFLLLGRRSDMPRVQAALDIATSSAASGEGFPNIIGEAMSCGIPCVATDVGDSAEIVGDCGIIVEPRDPDALAAGWRRIIDSGIDGRRSLGEACRTRIEKNYEIGSVTARYEVLYLGLSRDRG